MTSASKGIISDGVLYCDHISSKDSDEVRSFSVKRPEIAEGLERYLKEDALYDEENDLMRTYLVRDYETDELVGYFSIKAGMVSLNERQIAVNGETGETITSFDTVPGIEIANFAVNQQYLDGHVSANGIGLLIYNVFIRKIVSQIATMLGVKMLYIFALPEDSLIEQYGRYYHFERLDKKSENELHSRLKPFYDMSCVFMYQMLN